MGYCYKSPKCRSDFRAQAIGRSWKVSEAGVSKSLKSPEETVSRNYTAIEASGKELQKSEVNAIGKWRKGGHCYIVAEGLEILSPYINWEV